MLFITRVYPVFGLICYLRPATAACLVLSRAGVTHHSHHTLAAAALPCTASYKYQLGLLQDPPSTQAGSIWWHYLFIFMQLWRPNVEHK